MQSAKDTGKHLCLCALWLVLLLGLMALPPSAHGQTFSVLHSFKGGTDGGTPVGVIRDAAGNLYGTTVYGGGVGCPAQVPSGCGTVFKLDTTGKETVLHDFGAVGDGQFPVGSLIRDAAGNLYGATANGGGVQFCGTVGCGTVFKLNSTGTETALHPFSGRYGGAFPGAGVIRDAAGNLYGTTSFGGAFGSGTVFKLDPNGKETVLYSFTGGADGSIPNGVIRDSAGNLYGTTVQGGNLTSCGSTSGCGTIFKVDPSGKETVLYTFNDGTDGGAPFAGVIRDAAGNLYGTTTSGGTSRFYGTAYELDTAGKFTVLHSFTGGSDGGVSQLRRNPGRGGQPLWNDGLWRWELFWKRIQAGHSRHVDGSLQLHGPNGRRISRQLNSGLSGQPLWHDGAGWRSNLRLRHCL